jgi:hypothetical protein
MNARTTWGSNSAREKLSDTRPESRDDHSPLPRAIETSTLRTAEHPSTRCAWFNIHICHSTVNCASPRPSRHYRMMFAVLYPMESLRKSSDGRPSVTTGRSGTRRDHLYVKNQLSPLPAQAYSTPTLHCETWRRSWPRNNYSDCIRLPYILHGA